jgi:hypothetical protein
MKRIAIAVSLVAMLALASTALAIVKLAGTWQTTIKTTALGGQLNGVWTIKFKAKGHHYIVTDAGQVVTQGNYKVKGKDITFHDQTGPLACPGAGKYSFHLSGTTLTFTMIKDSPKCPGRQAVLAGTFTKLS